MNITKLDNEKERRREARAVFQATVRLNLSGDRIFEDCETSDISVSGLFVKGITGVDAGEKCDVEMNLSGRASKLVFRMIGEVVRVQEDGVALQFFDVDEESFYHLQNIVYFNYKHSDAAGELIAVAANDIDDESLYYGANSGRKTAPLSDDYLDDVDGEFGDDSDDDFSGIIRREQDDEDLDY